MSAFPKDFSGEERPPPTSTRAAWDAGGRGPALTDVITAGTATAPRMETYQMPDGSIKLAEYDALPGRSKACGGRGLLLPQPAGGGFLSPL